MCKVQGLALLDSISHVQITAPRSFSSPRIKMMLTYKRMILSDKKFFMVFILSSCENMYDKRLLMQCYVKMLPQRSGQRLESGVSQVNARNLTALSRAGCYEDAARDARLSKDDRTSYLSSQVTRENIHGFGLGFSYDILRIYFYCVAIPCYQQMAATPETEVLPCFEENEHFGDADEVPRNSC